MMNMATIIQGIDLMVKVALLVTSLVFGSMLSDIAQTAKSTDQALGKILLLIEQGPEQVTAVGNAVSTGITGVGDSTATQMERARDALEAWRSPSETLP